MFVTYPFGWRAAGRAPYAAVIIAEFRRAEAAMLRDQAIEAGSGQAALGKLPEWDLADLYPGRDSPELARDLAALAAELGGLPAAL